MKSGTLTEDAAIDRKVIVHNGVVGDLPLALVLDSKISAQAKVVACLLWSQSYVLADGRRVVAYQAKHVASAIGSCFGTAALHVRELRAGGYIARIQIDVPEFAQQIAGYWLSPKVREAVRVRNARARAAKASPCHGDGRSDPAPALGALEPSVSPVSSGLRATDGTRVRVHE